MKLDLNCDLGEGETWQKTRALMHIVTSANVACGGHAGDRVSMENCLRLASAQGVRVGAHPGAAGNFGRGEVALHPGALQTLVLHQVGALHRLCQIHQIRLRHVKLHGTLYHATDADAGLAEAYLEVIRTCFPGVLVYARAGGGVAIRARQLGMRVWEEGFADRHYESDGTLVARGQPGALIRTPRTVANRLREYLETGQWCARDGTAISLRFQTVCLHSDSPNAVALATAAAAVLSSQGQRQRQQQTEKKAPRRSRRGASQPGS